MSPLRTGACGGLYVGGVALMVACGASPSHAPDTPVLSSVPSVVASTTAPGARQRAALAAEADGRFAAAQSELERAAGTGDLNWAGWVNLARVQSLRGRSEQAARTAVVARTRFARETGSDPRVVRREPLHGVTDVEWLGADWLALVDGVRPRISIYSRGQRRIVAELDLRQAGQAVRDPRVSASRVVGYLGEGRDLKLLDLATMVVRSVATSRPVVWYDLSPNADWIGVYEAWGASVQSLPAGPDSALSLLGAAGASLDEPRCRPSRDTGPTSDQLDATRPVQLTDAGGKPVVDAPFRATTGAQTHDGSSDAAGWVHLPRGADYVVRYGASPYDPADLSAPSAYDYLTEVSTRDEGPGECYNTRHASQPVFLPDSSGVLLLGERATRMYTLPDGKLTHAWAKSVRTSYGVSRDSKQFLFAAEPYDPGRLHRFDLDSGSSRALVALDALGAGWVGDRIAVATSKTLSLWDRDMTRTTWSADFVERAEFDTKVEGSPDAAAVVVHSGHRSSVHDARMGRVESVLDDAPQPGVRSSFALDDHLTLCGLYWCRWVDLENGVTSDAVRLPQPMASDAERGVRRVHSASPSGMRWAVSAEPGSSDSGAAVVVPPAMQSVHWLDENGGLAVREADGTLCRWKVNERRPAEMVVTPTAVAGVELLGLSATGHAALIRREGQRLEVLNADTLRVRLQLGLPPGEQSWALLTRDGSRVILGAWESNEVSVVEVANGQRTTKAIRGADYLVGHSAVSDVEGRVLYVGEGGGRVRVVDWSAGHVVYQRLVAAELRTAAELSPDGHTVALALVDASGELLGGQRLEIVDLATRRVKESYALLDGPRSEAALHVDDALRWRFAGAEADQLRRQYFCRFGRLLAPFELCR